MTKLKLILTIGLISLSMSTALADERLVASSEGSTKSCKHTDGYGEYQGSGSTIHAARSGATIQCVMSKVEAYERSHSGLTPDEDTVDLYMDACVNICN